MLLLTDALEQHKSLLSTAKSTSLPLNPPVYDSLNCIPALSSWRIRSSTAALQHVPPGRDTAWHPPRRASLLREASRNSGHTGGEEFLEKFSVILEKSHWRRRISTLERRQEKKLLDFPKYPVE